ncbi:uncharacterized protein PHACADRAFT_178866 [Phanerochaete carnosa HHB-10118-sp]|uniref:F-box domain-containing protein n=1 Tax=Phanerochaete carnosa (strain HHB-10118-sp) TaxID=650164 RepID=K5WJ90_PHACS|nr:uncharacterized protein PHACADRAFT_178866 [Phanerochaete carnosa HHB-10118-sp]EKM50287.1 hypothetical protein PHACADRAFT_178866 [Phanerochaete carnosa HHB-10118-sp]
MPPRGKKRKVGSTEQETGPEHAEKNKAKQVEEEEKVARNTTGLLSLPVEIFEQIYEGLLSTSRLITKEQVLENKPHLSEEFVYRTDVLWSLTRTCHALRVSCLPRYYEHVEACVVRGPRVWYKQLAERLERTSWLLVECPHLARHVQTVTVSLTRCSTGTVLPAFAACLKALPNLHTLQIMHAHSQMTTALKDAFEYVSLPQIRTLILPTCAHNILRACPNIVDLTCNEGDGSQLISAMAKASPNVEVVREIRLWSEASSKRLAKAAPKLRELYVYSVDKIGPFMQSKTLSKICITRGVESRRGEDVRLGIEATSKAMSAELDEAKRILASSMVKSDKCLEVVFTARDFEREARLRQYSSERFYKVVKTLTFSVP